MFSNIRMNGLAIVFLWAMGRVCAAGETLPPPPAGAGEHRVFAHFMTCFTLSVEHCEHEIGIAMRHGIDGFAMDFGAYGKYDKKKDDFEVEGYIRGLDNIFEAAKRVSPEFKILLTPEYSVKPMERAIPHMIRRYHDHPNVMRLDGKMVLSSYGASAKWLHPYIEEARKNGIEVLFVPFSGTGRHAMTLSFEQTLRLLDEPSVHGIWRFACDSTPRSIMRHNATARRATLFRNKLYMAGIAANYNSANVRDMQGLRGYAAVWESLIRDNADWVEIVTWNDYNEDTNLMHFKWKRLWDKVNYNRDGALLDATGYWTAWYKSGVAPAIPQDRIYFAYRDRSRYLVKGYDPKKDEWVDHTMTQWPFTQIHDDLLDRVYVSTFLTQPATLTVRLAGEDTAFEMPAGVTHRDLPMKPGVPVFSLARGGKTVLDVVGRRSIIEKETEISSPLGYHRPTRIWLGGAAAGRDAAVEAEAGQIAAPAEVRDVDGGKAVFFPSKEGPAVTVDLPAVKTGMYNLRFVYSNPGDYDARLMLFADGLDLGDKLETYSIPLWLPPTGEGRFATATLCWTLNEKNKTLRIECHRKDPPPEDAPEKDRKHYKKPDFGWNDRGEVLIDRIEFVRMEEFAAASPRDPQKPAMRPIPGGAFTMGGPGGQPDELPARQVTISPFAMGTCEVTNEEFEAFWPEHRQWRDGYSWRDREPVIYVDWRDCARYCNWLSEQHGLDPVYAEEKGAWKTDLSKNGFRMPTEAEWEYVATGRGENRTYPWGDAAPVPMGQGNFEGEDALRVPSHLRSTEGKGTVVVGSFPSGASRDGVMDMAGNVCEFCSDWYRYYPEDAQTDPVQQKESHSRVQRGGSWGYYGFSQRSRDREFNSQTYPGYVYVGFRLAISEEGYRKVYGEASP